MNGNTSYPLLQRLYDGVNKVGDNIIKLNKRVTEIAGRVPEITASLLYVILHIVISVFHEPWYDEAVAWQIAKCASIKDIIFKLPHYEGHPPLWHLILALFAKTGCPYEFTLSLLGLLFAGGAVMLIIWKAPFPRIVRLLLPFTYYFFYQYGVISRPYSLMMLAFVLAAIAYKDRDAKPWRFVLTLMLLCLFSAYGILFAGGITVAWLLGLLKKEGFRFLLDKRRTLSLFCLLVLAILLLLEIWPADDTFALTYDKLVPEGCSVFVRLLYTFFAIPADNVITNIFGSGVKLSVTSLDYYLLAPGVIIGLAIWTAMIYTARKKGTVLTLTIPFSLFAVFTAVKYCSVHHTGLSLLFFVFWAWCTCSEDNYIEHKNKSIERIMYSVMRVAGVIFMAVSLYWSVMASVHELTYVYGIGKKEAEFIADHDLDDYNIMINYFIFYEYDENGQETDTPMAYDFNHCDWADGLLPYFDHNIFFNLNDGRDDMAYTFNKFSGLEENGERIERWREQGAPDVLFLPYDFSLVYDGITDMGDYLPVFFSDIKTIWKASSNDTYSIIYVRTDIAKELGLTKADSVNQGLK